MKKIFQEIVRLPEFDRDFKKLIKRYVTLEEDLKRFIETGLILYHKLKIDNKGIVPMVGLGIDSPKIYKARKFACRSLRGGAFSGIRVIYAYFEETDTIVLIEIYYKEDKKTEDRERILKYYKA
ncbi:MAG: hypothetical protein ACETWC_02490 [Acidobacteriota bacterium]